MSADTGCAMNYNFSNETIYGIDIGPAPANTARTNYTGPIIYNNLSNPTACPRYDYNSVSNTSTIRCCINNVCNTAYRQVIYTRINCPLDNYLFILVPLIGLLGILGIRQSPTKSNLNRI